MRRLLALAAVAAAALVPVAPASAAYTCRPVLRNPSGGAVIGVCAGTWCLDGECYVVLSTTCAGWGPVICSTLDGLGFPPPGR